LTQPADYAEYSSFHQGYVNFAFGDGSVRSFSKIGASSDFANGSARWYNLMYAAGTQDGSVIQWGVLGE
jgi:prepilin-type processing-associated H-X9-DG protein